jgi:hypothetical protein
VSNLFLFLNAIIKLTEFLNGLHAIVESEKSQQEKILLDKAIQTSKNTLSTEELQKEIGKLL